MITGILLSYVFLGVSIISIAAYLYFRLLTIKTSPGSYKRNEIIGDMKNPEDWREKNRKMSHVCMFWFIVSIAAFIILKFFYSIRLFSIIYLLIYAILIVLSIIFYPGINKKASI